MTSTKIFLAAAISIGAIIATVPVVGAQETAVATSSKSSAKAANRQLAKQVQTTLYKQKVWNRPIFTLSLAAARLRWSGWRPIRSR